MTRNTRLSTRYWSLVKRLGKKKAILAVAHTILRIIYHILKSKQPYIELGPEYVKKKKANSEAKLVKQLEALGYQISKSA